MNFLFFLCKEKHLDSDGRVSPLISNGYCGVCSPKSKVAGSTPLCGVGLLKGAGRDRGSTITFITKLSAFYCECRLLPAIVVGLAPRTTENDPPQPAEHTRHAQSSV